MNKREFSIISSALKTYYPRENLLPTEAAMTLWYEQLRDLDYDTLEKALNLYVSTDVTGYSPSIGKLRSLAADITTPMFMNGLEAWSVILKAVSNSAYNYNEEFAKLPPILQRVIGSPSILYRWSQMDRETLNSVEQSHFLKMYEGEKQRETFRNTTPLKDLVKLPEPDVPETEEPLMIEQNENYADLKRYEELIRKIKDGTFKKSDLKKGNTNEQ